MWVKGTVPTDFPTDFVSEIVMLGQFRNIIKQDGAKGGTGYHRL